MKLLLSECPEGHKEVSWEHRVESLDLGTRIKAKKPVRIDLDVERRGDQLILRGSVQLDWSTVCARCAKPVEKAFCGEILAFADRRGQDQPEDEATLEQEGSILYHDGIEVSLTETIREAILLGEPARVLCGEACKGLCQACGKDLNEGACDCPAETNDSRWQVLRERDSGES